MTVRLLQPGDLMLDYSGLRPNMAAVAKAGARGILRYSAGVGNSDSATQFKLCGRNEIHEALTANIDFVANSEWYESRVTEGAAAGKLDATSDLAFWRSRNLAKGAHIYYSWDAAPVRSAWDAVYGYLSEAQDIFEGHYNADVYAGTPFIEYLQRKGLPAHGRARHKPRGWRPNAGSWSNDGLPYEPATRTARQRKNLVATSLAHSSASIYQTGNYWFSRQADENLLLRVPIGSQLDALHGRTTADGGGGKPPVHHPKPGPGEKPDSKHPGSYFLVSPERHSYARITDEGSILVHANGVDRVVTTRKAQQ